MALKSPQEVARDHIASGSKTSSSEVAYHMSQMGVGNGLRSEQTSLAPQLISAPAGQSGPVSPYALLAILALIIAGFVAWPFLMANGERLQDEKMARRSAMLHLPLFFESNIPGRQGAPANYVELKKALIAADPANAERARFYESRVSYLSSTNDEELCRAWRQTREFLSVTGFLEEPAKFPGAARYAEALHYKLGSFDLLCPA